MEIFRHMGTVVVDSKDIFSKTQSIASLGDMVWLEYENFNLAFSGFVRFGDSFGGIPILLSLDKEKKKALMFAYSKNNPVQRRLIVRIHEKLNLMGYEVTPIRLEVESYNVGKN